MENNAKKIIVFSLASILLSGVGAPIVQAAPQNRNDRQQHEQQLEQERDKEKEKQRSDSQRQEKQRNDQQRVNAQRQEEQRRTEQNRVSAQRQEEQRRTEQNRISAQRQEEQRREEQRRLYAQRQEEQRREEQRRLYAHRDNDRGWQNRDDHRRDDDRRWDDDRRRNYEARRHIYNNERYRSPYWGNTYKYVEYRQPWKWYSTNHSNRRLITDGRWNQEFPDLRSYSWHGSGFWYQGNQYRDLILFCDEADSLVAIGFWHGGRFVMIRHDDRSYYNHSPYVLRSRDAFININIRL